MAAKIKLKYPKFLIVELADYGPHIWTFELVSEVVEFLWGKYLPQIAVFKDGEVVYLESGDIDEIRRQLDGK